MSTRRRLTAWLIVVGAFALSFGALQPRAAAQPSTALAKPCWPEDSLKGRDTAYYAFPCNDVRALPIGMRVQVECVMTAMKDGGWDAKIYETWRSRHRVWYLYQFGRTLPGPIVTKASNPLAAPHYWGYGVDIVHRTKLWNHPRFFYWLAVHYEECGLVAGGFWKSFPDAPHGQFAAFESVTRAPPLIARLMREGKRDSLWLVSGAIR